LITRTAVVKAKLLAVVILFLLGDSRQKVSAHAATRELKSSELEEEENSSNFYGGLQCLVQLKKVLSLIPMCGTRL
jgi:hypothetical protein